MAVNTVTQYLGLNVKTGVTPQLRRIRGVGTVTAVGPTFGALDTGGTVSVNQPLNRAVFFNGALFAVVGVGIYISTNGGLSWSLINTLSGLSSSTSFKSGLNVVTVDNVPYLCILYLDTTSNPRGSYSSDGITWNVNTITGFALWAEAFSQDTVWQSKLWAFNTYSITNTLFSYQPGPGGGFQIISLPSGESAARCSMCVFNNKLYITGWNGTTRPLYILEGSVLNQITSLGTFTGTANDSYKPSFLVDSPYLYVFALKTVGSTWGCWQIDSSNNIVDVTSTVIPSGMTGTSPAANTSRTLTFVDTDWAPGTNPPKYLIHANDGNAGTSTSLYAWQGPNSPMLLLDTGGDVATAVSITKYPTASGFFIVGPPVCVVKMVSPATSGVGLKISFLIQAPATAANTNVRLWYKIQTDPYLQRLGNLSDPSAGSLNSASTAVLNLSPDNITVYNFIWTPPASILGDNGVGSRYSFALEAFS